VACDEGGIDAIGLADSPAVSREIYITAAQAVAATSRSTIMTAVTNPISRDVSVVASAVATLEEMAPGRVALGIGTGDSALWGVGLRSAKVDSMRDYITALESYWRGEKAVYRDRTFASMWSGWEHPADIPVLVACSGTKVLRMAAQVADCLILAMGFGAHNLEYVQQNIEEACAEVGRDPGELEIWGHGALTFGLTVGAAMEENLGVNPGWLTLGTLEGNQIPAHHRAALVELTASFGDLDAEYGQERRGAHLVRSAKELGLYDWLSARAPRLWGPPLEIAKRLIDLAAAGVPNWIFYLPGTDLDRSAWIDTFTTQVLPRIRAAG
jgi:alkanesulfonate monooxygenase SsuD/methylene tetrahydromethanopterin reductase-like flavin-dependent oxidoreductase (luciferase family)